MYVFDDALGFPSVALHVKCINGGEVGADNPLCSLDDPLKKFPLSQSGVFQTTQ